MLISVFFIVFIYCLTLITIYNVKNVILPNYTFCRLSIILLY
nr:MAG TPA: hypothetical protein [Caudoviricetes sp.]